MGVDFDVILSQAYSAKNEPMGHYSGWPDLYSKSGYFYYALVLKT